MALNKRPLPLWLKIAGMLATLPVTLLIALFALILVIPRQLNLVKLEDWKLCWRFVPNSLLGRVSKTSFSAITLAHNVFFLTIDAEIENHEEWHCRQQMCWNLPGSIAYWLIVGLSGSWFISLPLLFGFLVMYGFDSLLAWLTGGDPYWDNHFEKQAYREEGKTEALGD